MEEATFYLLDAYHQKYPMSIFFDVRFSTFDFTYLHLCKKPSTKIDKLGYFWVRFFWSPPLGKQPSLFDVRFSMFVLGNVCGQHIHQSRIQRLVLSVICVYDLFLVLEICASDKYDETEAMPIA